MKRARWKYAASAGVTGLLLVGLGWGFGNFYLVAAGALLLASGLAWTTLPMPVLF